jgi:hypothetical protein
LEIPKQIWFSAKHHYRKSFISLPEPLHIAAFQLISGIAFALNKGKCQERQKGD